MSFGFVSRKILGALATLDVTVAALGFGNDFNRPVQTLAEVIIRRDRVRRALSLHEFVELTVIERRAAIPSLGQPGGDFEVTEEVRVVRTFH